VFPAFCLFVTWWFGLCGRDALAWYRLRTVLADTALLRCTLHAQRAWQHRCVFCCPTTHLRLPSLIRHHGLGSLLLEVVYWLWVWSLRNGSRGHRTGRIDDGALYRHALTLRKRCTARRIACDPFLPLPRTALLFPVTTRLPHYIILALNSRVTGCGSLRCLFGCWFLFWFSSEQATWR